MLWINDKRTDDNNQPHLKGKLNLPDGDLWVSAWKSPDKEGNMRLSISTTPVDANAEKPKSYSQAVVTPATADDDIPF
jgi:hypothetical protein